MVSTLGWSSPWPSTWRNSTRRPLSPAALYLARSFATKLGESESESALTALIQDREQAEALQRDFPRLPFASKKRKPKRKSSFCR